MSARKREARWPAPTVVAVVPGLRHPIRLDTAAASFGNDFAGRLAQAVPGMRGTPRTVKANVSGFQRWLAWIAERAAQPAAQANEDCRTVKRHIESLKPGAMATEVLSRVCNAYGEWMADRGPDGKPRFSLARRRHMMSQVLTTLRQIGRQIGLQEIRTGPRVLARPGDRFEDGVPSLAEITRRGRVNWENPDEALRDLLHDSVTDHEALSFDAKMRAVAKLNGIRLAALRRLLERELLAAHERFLQGDHLLSLPGLPPPELVVDMLERNNTNTRNRRDAEVAAWISDVTGGDPEMVLGLALTWLAAKARLGVLPDVDETASWRQLLTRNPEVRDFLDRAANGAAGKDSIHVAIQDRLALGWRGWTAAFGILLIDTGWNVQPLLDLPANPFVGSSGNGKRTIATTKALAAFKNRAGHEVDAVLAAAGDEGAALSEAPGTEENLSGVRVIEIVQQMTRRMRASEGEGPLFLCVHMKSGEPSVPGLSEQGKWWNDLLAIHAEDPVVGGLPITRTMIRKTLTDIAAMENSGDHAPAQLLANHGSSATTMQRYLRSPWFKREMANHIRRFQGLFEAALTSGILDVAERLKVAPEELERRRSVAMETGLGFACVAPTDGIQPGTMKGQTCTRLDRCHLGCPARRFVPTGQGMASLVLANRSLRAAEDEWIAQNPDRWRCVWMPLLAETEVYIARLKDGAYRPRLLAAEAEVDAKLAEGEFSLIIPW